MKNIFSVYGVIGVGLALCVFVFFDDSVSLKSEGGVSRNNSGKRGFSRETIQPLPLATPQDVPLESGYVMYVPNYYSTQEICDMFSGNTDLSWQKEPPKKFDCQFHIGTSTDFIALFDEGNKENIVLFPKGFPERIQKIPRDVYVELSVGDFSLAHDFNFDGYKDIQIESSRGATNGFADFYFYNPKTGLFEKKLSDLANPVFDPKNKKITTTISSSWIENAREEFSLRDGKYESTFKEAYTDYDLEKHTIHFEREVFHNGGWEKFWGIQKVEIKTDGVSDYPVFTDIIEMNP